METLALGGEFVEQKTPTAPPTQPLTRQVDAEENQAASRPDGQRMKNVISTEQALQITRGVNRPFS